MRKSTIYGVLSPERSYISRVRRNEENAFAFAIRYYECEGSKSTPTFVNHFESIKNAWNLNNFRFAHKEFVNAVYRGNYARSFWYCSSLNNNYTDR